MIKHRFHSLLAIFLVCVGVHAGAAAPNFVVIMADDLGWMDINPTAEVGTGTPASQQYYETPHLNRLSEDGVSFSRCYAAPLCTPSRATILTGRNGAMYGFNNASAIRQGGGTFASKGVTPKGAYLPHDKMPGSRAQFPVSTAVANYALPNGLPDSKGMKVYSFAEMLPEYRSAFLGKWHLGGGDIDGHRPQDFGFEAITYEDEGWSPYTKGIRKRWHHTGPEAKQDYLTDDLTELSTDWIREHVSSNPDQPFLLYLAHFSVHGPWEAKPDDVAYFESKSTRGWNDQKHAIYAAMIRSLDDSVGAIRKTLEEEGVWENTVLVFTSDNGAQVFKKGNYYTSSTPLRGQKAQPYEGGIRVPLIFGGAGIKRNGTWVDTPVSLEDIAPTLASMSGKKIKKDIRDQWTGQTLLPLLNDHHADFSQRSIFIQEPWYRPNTLLEGSPYRAPCTVMIDGDYKLIAHHDGEMYLYNLKGDIGEKNDLSAKMPERVARMKNQVAKWRFKNIPARYDTSANPSYDPKLEGALPKPQGDLFVR